MRSRSPLRTDCLVRGLQEQPSEARPCGMRLDRRAINVPIKQGHQRYTTGTQGGCSGQLSTGYSGEYVDLKAGGQGFESLSSTMPAKCGYRTYRQTNRSPGTRA